MEINQPIFSIASLILFNVFFLPRASATSKGPGEAWSPVSEARRGQRISPALIFFSSMALLSFFSIFSLLNSVSSYFASSSEAMLRLVFASTRVIFFHARSAFPYSSLSRNMNFTSSPISDSIFILSCSSATIFFR